MLFNTLLGATFCIHEDDYAPARLSVVKTTKKAKKTTKRKATLRKSSKSK